MIKLDKQDLMELNIDVIINSNCQIQVSDTSTYLDEGFSGTVKGKFKFSETVTIDVLQHNKSTGAEYRDPVFTTHDTLKSVTVPIEFDGWFDAVHIVLPSAEWFDRESSKSEGSALNLYNLVYFSDGKNIYKYIGGKVTQVSINDIAQVNTVDTTISRTSKEFVSICLLKKCFANICQQIFNSREFSSCKSNNVDSELTYKRDLVWMAINIIKYLTECEQLAEAERIIEVMQSCNGVCNNQTISTNGCGCTKTKGI